MYGTKFRWFAIQPWHDMLNTMLKQTAANFEIIGIEHLTLGSFHNSKNQNDTKW